MIYTPAFERFWSAWPSNGGRYSRKGGKSACLAVWIKRYHWTQADTIVAHVEWLKTTEAWLKDSGAYIPAPLVYLNQQRWDGADIPHSTPAEPVPETADIKRSNQWFADQEVQMSQAIKGPEVKERIEAIKRKLGRTA